MENFSLTGPWGPESRVGVGGGGGCFVCLEGLVSAGAPAVERSFWLPWTLGKMTETKSSTRGRGGETERDRDGGGRQRWERESGTEEGEKEHDETRI